MDVEFLIDKERIFFDELATQEINSNLVSGSVYGIKLETGLSFYVWSLEVEKKGHLIQQFSCEGGGKIYLLNYHLQPQFNRIENVHGEEIKVSTNKNAAVFLQECPGLANFFYTHRATLHFISIAFNEQWLSGQLRNVKDNSPALQSVYQIFQTAFARGLSKSESVLIQSLFDIFRDKAYALDIKAHIYYVLSFFYRQSSLATSHAGFNEYMPAMIKIEKTIIDSLFTSIPPLDELAKSCFISTSTLKRQFKEMFGLSVYDYYLAKKMELAKQLLQNEDLSVNEVSSRLHYESVSHFSAIFKKTYGYPPGKAKNRDNDE